MLYRVTTAADVKRSAPKKFLSSDKKQLLLPAEMSAIHIDFTDYYFPEGINYPGENASLHSVCNNSAHHDFTRRWGPFPSDMCLKQTKFEETERCSPVLERCPEMNKRETCAVQSPPRDSRAGASGRKQLRIGTDELLSGRADDEDFWPFCNSLSTSPLSQTNPCKLSGQTQNLLLCFAVANEVVDSPRRKKGARISLTGETLFISFKSHVVSFNSCTFQSFRSLFHDHC